MPKNFKVYISNFGNKTGLWHRHLPLPQEGDISVQRIYETLVIDNGVLTFGTSSGINESGLIEYFLGKIELYGGNTEDGIYNSINDLPAGFFVTDVHFHCTIAGVIVVSAVLTSLNAGISNYNTGSSIATFTFTNIPTTFQLLTDKIGLNLTANQSGSNYLVISDLYALGTYTIQSWTSTITSETEIKTLANIDVQPVEEPVVIESDPDDPDAIDFTQLDPTEPIILAWDLERASIALPFIITITTHYLEFIIDVYLLRLIRRRGRVIVKILLKGGTQFSGEVEAGTLEILFFDGTGVYKITLSRRSDLIYVEENVTQEFKIPDPFIKTGYIGT